MKFLSFGSVNRDIVYSVDHIVRPGETISTCERKEYWGGKGQNQCIALARAGAETYFAAKISETDVSLNETLTKEYGINTNYVWTDPQPTGHAIIQVNHNGQNSIIVYPGANHSISFAFIDEVLAGFSEGDIIVLQNEISNVEYILRASKGKGMCVVLNPSPFSKEMFEWAMEFVDLFIVNETECEALCGAVDPEALRAKFPNSEIVLTLGNKGAKFLGDSGVYSHGIYNVPVVDTTAAGDTFTGFFVKTYYSTKNAALALETASKASSIAVSRIGAVPSIPTAEEVSAADIVLL